VTQPGTVVGGRYEIVRKIADGGMGSVYEAIHLLSRRSVALKLLAPEVARDDAKRHRFLREVSAPAQIGHDGIVEIYDAGFDEKLGVLFVAMEHLQGETLRERLKRLGPALSPPGREHLVDLFERLLEALAAAHRRGIVHRDLKPENVFLHRRRDGTEVVKVLDFGIARELSIPSVTQTGIAMGTPHYMAPEQAMSARTASFPSDVWSLGAMLYELLSGEPPFQADSAGLVLAAAMTEAHRPIESLAPGVAPAFARLIDRCLAKRPEDRPLDAGALLEELRAARAHLAGAQKPASSGASEPLPSPASGPMTSPLLPPSGASPSSDATGPARFPATTAGAPLAPPSGRSVSVQPVPGVIPHAPLAAPPPNSREAGSREAGSREAGSREAWGLAGLGALVVLAGGGLCCLGGLFGLGVWGVGATGVGASRESLEAGPIAWTGQLSGGDRMEGSRYFDTYAFEAVAGQPFTVELVSDDFDPMLRLGTPGGRTVENDDWGGTLSSRILVPAAETGTYTVHVTTYGELASGAYFVSVHR
jgi:eukaryotic-like serine/threonine-protein kinase